MQTKPRPDAAAPPPEAAPAPSSRPESAAPPARRFQAPVSLRYRDFTLLWGGQAVSQMGTQMQIVATAWLIWKITGSELALGLVGLFRVVPLVVFALIGGVIADAVDRRRLLFVTQGSLLLLSAILAVTTATGTVNLWLIYAFITAGAIANAFDNPARSALVPNLVPNEHLANALTLSNINSQLGTIVGPAVAGFLLAAFGSAAGVYAVDAASFLAVIVALALIQTRLPATAGRKVSLGAAVEGLRFVRRTPIMASTMTLDFFATLLGVSPLLLPVFADQVFHVGADGLGVLYSATAVGALGTSLVLSFLSRVEHQGRVVLVAVAAYGIAGVVFGLSHNFLLALAALAVTGAADTASMVMRQTIRQVVTPDAMRGRMTSVNMVFFAGGPQLGNLQAGALAQVIGAGPATALGGTGVLLVVAATTALVPRLRQYRG